MCRRINMKTRLLFLRSSSSFARMTLVVGATLIIVGWQSVRADSWTRGLPLGQVAESERKSFEAFVLDVWSGDNDNHVHGLCTFTNVKSAPITLDGIETSSGDFYPKVVNQVADGKQENQWKTIEASPSRPGKPVTLTVEAMSVSKTLMVDLDVFRPFIGQQKRGRLLLETGEAAVFQIDDLQPPEKMTESSADAVKTER